MRNQGSRRVGESWPPLSFAKCRLPRKRKRGIQQNSPNALKWPATSPDLNSLDYFLPGVAESSVNEKLREIAAPPLAHLKYAIAGACGAIDVGAAKKAIRSSKKRFALRVEEGGGHVEQLVGGK